MHHCIFASKVVILDEGSNSYLVTLPFFYDKLCTLSLNYDGAMTLVCNRTPFAFVTLNIAVEHLAIALVYQNRRQ